MKFIYENYNKVEVSEGGWRGWARFNKTTGKELEKRSRKTRKQEKNKAIQIRRFGDVEVAPDAVRAHEGMMSDLVNKVKASPLNPNDRSRRRHKFKVKVQKNLKKIRSGIKATPKTEGTYMGTFDKKAIDKYMPKAKKPSEKKAMVDKKKLAKAYGIRDEAYPAGAEADMKKLHDKEKNTWWKSQDKSKVAADKMRAVKYNPKRSRSIDHSLKRAAKYAELSHELRNEGIGAAYMPQAGKGKTAERELTSKAILKQLNRNRNKSTMKGKTEVPHIRYVNARDKSTDLIRPEKRKKRGGKKKVRKEGYNLVEKASPKMTQLLRMGLAKKGELHTMLRAIKRGPDAMKDPKLRSKMFELLNKLVDIIEKDGQIFVKVRQNVQKNRADLQAVEEMLTLEGVILGVNKSFEQLNITEDMSGMSVSSGHKRSVAQGAGMTKKGVAAYRRRNPGSKLKTAVTTPPSKLKPGSKAANRRKAFCSRSRSWSSERGKAARRRWNC